MKITNERKEGRIRNYRDRMYNCGFITLLLERKKNEIKDSSGFQL